MKKNIILHIFPTFALGGQQRRFAELVNGFSAGFTHHVVSLSGEIEAVELIDKNVDLTTHHIPLQKGAFFHPANLQIFSALFQNIRPDLLCTYNWGAIEAVLSWRLQTGRLQKRIWQTFLKGSADQFPHIHFEDGFGPDETPTRQNQKRVMARRILLKRSKVIVPSVTLQQLALNKWQIDQSAIMRVPNGIHIDRFVVHNRVYDHMRPVKVGTVGALRPEKNIARLIDVFSNHKAETESRLQVVGDGPILEMLKQQAQNSSRMDDINFPGGSATPEQYYQNFDIFALSSDTEQMPISLIEAMVSGLPVVATNVGDVSAMVSEENRSFISPVGEDLLFQENLQRLIDDPVLRRSIGLANQKKALDIFDRVTMISIYENLFMDIIENIKS